MGLLDELRQAADSRKTDAEREAEKQARLLNVFRTTLSPKLLQIYRYFHELAGHLNLLNPLTEGLYRYPTIKEPITLHQSNYQVRCDTDSTSQETRETSILFECKRAQEIQFTVHKDSVVTRCEQFLYEHGLEFHCRKIKNDRFNVVSGEFFIKPRIPVAIHFTADIPNSVINLHMANFDDFGIRRTKLHPDNVDEQFLDDLGHYLLRRKPDFMKSEISAEARQRLKEQVAHTYQLEIDTLKEIEAQTRANQDSLLSNLFKRG